MASRKLTLLAEFSVASHRPSRLKASAWTSLSLPATILSCSPVETSQNLRVWSQLPEASRCPSGLNATPVTQPACPFNVWANRKSGGDSRVGMTGTAGYSGRTGGLMAALKGGGSTGSSLAGTVEIWFGSVARASIVSAFSRKVEVAPVPGCGEGRDAKPASAEASGRNEGSEAERFASPDMAGFLGCTRSC